jgi:nucleosome binding factor SPN SPT16 subunit
MADEVTIDKTTFHNRLSAFISQWKQDKRNGDTLFAGASSIAIVMGKSDDSQGFTKTSAMQFWLLGYEFPSTVFIITQDSMHIVTTKKKGICIFFATFMSCADSRSCLPRAPQGRQDSDRDSRKKQGCRREHQAIRALSRSHQNCRRTCLAVIMSSSPTQSH